MRVRVRSACWTSSSVSRRYVAPSVFLSPKSGRRYHTSAYMERPYRFQSIRVGRLFQYYEIVLRTKRLLRVRNVRGAAHDPEQGSAPAASARLTSPTGGSSSSDGLLERLAREEAHDPPGGNGGRGARLGVAADARPLGAHLPRAKAAQDDRFPLL